MHFPPEYNMSSDEEDEIIEEIPIYLSKTLEKNLFIFQYPHISQYTYDRLQQVSECQIRPKYHQIRYNLANETESCHKTEQTLSAQIALTSMVEKMINEFKEGVEPVSANVDSWVDSETSTKGDVKASDNNDSTDVKNKVTNFNNVDSVKDKINDKKNSKMCSKRKKIEPYRYPDRMPLSTESYVFSPNLHHMSKRLRKVLVRLRKKKLKASRESDEFFKTQVYMSSTLGKQSNTFMVGVYSNKALHLTPVIDIIKFKANCRTYGKNLEVQRNTRNKGRKKCAAEKGLLANINELEHQKAQIVESLSSYEQEMQKKRFEFIGADGKINDVDQMYLNCMKSQYAKKLDDIENLNDCAKRLQKIVDEFKPKPEIKIYKETRKPIEAEIWRPAKIHPPSSKIAEEQRQKFFANDFKDNDSFKMGYCGYINKLLPLKGKHRYVDIMLAPRAYNQARLSDLSRLDQLKFILKDGMLMTFQEIMNRMNQIYDPFGKKVLDEAEIIELLPEAGRIIHGNWVAQSEVVYVLQQDRNINGIPVSHLIRSRDYVIFCFVRSPLVQRKNVIAGAGLPLEELTVILSSIAHMNSNKLWELNLPPDEDFIKKYPDVVQKQNLFWEKNEAIFTAMDNRQNLKRPMITESPMPAIKRRRKNSVKKQSVTKPKKIQKTIAKTSNTKKITKKIAKNKR